MQVGDPVACMSYGSFSDYQLIPARQAMPVPVVAPEIVALLTSGLTASIGELCAWRLPCSVRIMQTELQRGAPQAPLSSCQCNHMASILESVATCFST